MRPGRAAALPPGLMVDVIDLAGAGAVAAHLNLVKSTLDALPHGKPVILHE